MRHRQVAVALLLTLLLTLAQSADGAANKCTWENKMKHWARGEVCKEEPRVSVGSVLGGAALAVGAVLAVPYALGAAMGISAAGPIAGGWFASMQAAAAGGGGLAAGGILATAQSLVMSGVAGVSKAAIMAGVMGGLFASNATTT
eukprot:1183590-Prorocentrum_minimum.AAC.4